MSASEQQLESKRLPKAGAAHQKVNSFEWDLLDKVVSCNQVQPQEKDDLDDMLTIEELFRL